MARCASIFFIYISTITKKGSLQLTLEYSIRELIVHYCQTTNNICAFLPMSLDQLYVLRYPTRKPSQYAQISIDIESLPDCHLNLPRYRSQTPSNLVKSRSTLNPYLTVILIFLATVLKHRPTLETLERTLRDHRTSCYDQRGCPCLQRDQNQRNAP